VGPLAGPGLPVYPESTSSFGWEPSAPLGINLGHRSIVMPSQYEHPNNANGQVVGGVKIRGVDGMKKRSKEKILRFHSCQEWVMLSSRRKKCRTKNRGHPKFNKPPPVSLGLEVPQLPPGLVRQQRERRVEPVRGMEDLSRRTKITVVVGDNREYSLEAEYGI